MKSPEFLDVDDVIALQEVLLEEHGDEGEQTHGAAPAAITRRTFTLRPP